MCLKPLFSVSNCSKSKQKKSHVTRGVEEFIYFCRIRHKMLANKDNLSRLGKCLMCKEFEAKYRCPGCDLVTCSAPCIARHKKELECTGIRSKTEFVPVKKMNEIHLLSDYRLLEELSRVKDSCSRNKIPKSSKDTPLPNHLQKLRKAISQRKCRIYFLPRNFSRHAENSTFFDWKANIINWKLSVTFLHAQKYNLIVAKCPDNISLHSIVDKCLNAAGSRKKELKKHFEAYKYSKDDIQVLLQAEKVPGAKQKLFVLDNNKTLKENLEGKRIVEFPELYIVLKGFYGAENLKDVQENISKSKCGNLLISNYSLFNDKEGEDDSETTDDTDEDDEMDDDKDEDDALDMALDCLEGESVKNILSSLYKQTTDG